MAYCLLLPLPQMYLTYSVPSKASRAPLDGTSVADDIARGLCSPPSPGIKMWAVAEFILLVETPLA